MRRSDIAEAVARGWTHTENEHKEMDATLAYAIVDEIWRADNQPNLGLATTKELLMELMARVQVNGTAEYRSVKS